jgi:hypothetical protein
MPDRTSDLSFHDASKPLTTSGRGPNAANRKLIRLLETHDGDTYKPDALGYGKLDSLIWHGSDILSPIHNWPKGSWEEATKPFVQTSIVSCEQKLRKRRA